MNKNKIEKLLFYLFVFTAPFQTRVILKIWSANSAVNFNEWTSAFLYGSDILILLLLFLGVKRIFDRLKKLETADFFLLAFISVSAVSVFFAENKALGFYRLVKVVEFSLLYYYVNSSGIIFNLAETLKAIMFSGIFQSIIAICQSLFQKSLGLKILGESFLRINLNGIAVVPADGIKFLRAYGTTPHPNVLAAWLFLSIFAFYFWYLYEKKERPVWTILSFYPLILVAFLFTFSRIMVALWTLGLVLRLIFVAVKRKSYGLSSIFKKRLFLLITISSVVIVVFSFFYWPEVKSRLSMSTDDLAVSERIFYNKIGGETAAASPVLGVGLGNFVWHTLKNFHFDKGYLYQPVHNIYILIASESGFTGLATFLFFIFCLAYYFISKTGLRELYQLSLFIVFMSVLVMGLFDHFFWTLQQGQIIFWAFLGLISRIS